MKINLKYFGMVAEMLGMSEELLHIGNNLRAEDLCNLLEEKYNTLNKIDYRLAINENVINENIELAENDTVAILPPFSGG